MPGRWPSGHFISMSWIGSFFIASRNSAWLKAYGVNWQKRSQLLNWEVAPDVYKTWPGSEQQSQHMPVQPQKACQKPPPPQRRLGKQGQRPRAVKSFHPQHQSRRADCLGMLFLKIQKNKMDTRWRKAGMHASGHAGRPPGCVWKVGDPEVFQGHSPSPCSGHQPDSADSSRCRPVPQCTGPTRDGGWAQSGISG